MPNPFILDCTLATRTYCQGFENSCEATPNTSVNPYNLTLNISPNPAKHHVKISFKLPTSGQVQLSVKDIFGRNLLSVLDGSLTSDDYVYEIPVDQIGQSLIFVNLTVLSDQGMVVNMSKKVILHK